MPIQLALVLSCAILLFVANSLPILSLQVYGSRTSTTLPAAIGLMVSQNQPAVALLVFLCALALPAFEIAAQLYLLIPMVNGRRPPGYRWVLRSLQRILPWCMVEVFMIGVLVAFSKLSNVADVVPGTALWLFAILTVLLTWVNSIPFRLFWEALKPSSSFDSLELGDDPRLKQSNTALTAKRAGLLPCHTCGLLVKKSTIPRGCEPACPRCNSKLHQRAPQSLKLTWIYLLASVVLYIPANTLPVMHTATLLGSKDDTILSGVVFLWDTGSWFLAVVVFVASIIVPLLKISALALLAATAQKRSNWQCEQRGRLYRLLELVGRWSMLDLFVVTLMAALVRQRALASIVAGPAAAAFGAVVVLTVLAAQGFDPRLTWDACDSLKVDK